MDCVGIYMDKQTHNALFNPALTLHQCHRVMLESEGVSPEVMLHRVSTTARYSEPYAVVKYRDVYSELIVAEPKNDYQLLICADAPFYSGATQ